MDHELEVIRTQMEHTRSSLADKIEALETEFRGTVEGATNAVSNTVESVQETVANVKESVQETVETVKESLDVRRHVERHPWAMFGGAMLVGCFAGMLVGRRRSRKPAPEPAPAPAAAPSREPAVHGNGTYRNGSAPKDSAEEEGLLGSSLSAIKGLAVGTLMGVLRDVLVNAVPTNLAPELAGVVDDMTTRLGGTPLQRTDDTNDVAAVSPEESSRVQSEPAKVGRPLGATRWSR